MRFDGPQSWTIVTGISVLLLLLGSSPAYTQPLPDSLLGDTVRVSDHIEPLLDTFSPTDQSSRQWSEQFTNLARNPLNLNEASAAELSYLPGLSSVQAHRIVGYRTEHGPYSELNGLRAVEGITKATVRSVRPFLTVESATIGTPFPSFNTIASNLDFEVVQRFERDLDLGRGYAEDRFLGAPGRLTTRLHLRYERRVELAVTLDKDPGEPVRWSPSTDTYGFDHVVGSFTVRNLGRIETLILGNFSAQFGQGVALWQGIRFGKGRDPVSPALGGGRGLVSYSSASESGYFRGIGTTVRVSKRVFATGFVSHRHRDASVDSSLALPSSEESPVPVRTLSRDGTHRTPSEIERKGTFGETTYGGAAEYRSPTLRVGIAGYRSRFGRPLRPGEKPYRRFRVAGRGTSMISAYSSAQWANYVLFGELARSPNGAWGGIVGAALDESDGLQWLLLGRYFPRDLSNFYGNAFGERDGAQNEIGIYTGLKLQIAEDWEIGTYFDQYRFPWLRFTVARPSTGWESRSVIKYSPRPWLSTYLQFRFQSDERGTEASGPGDRALEAIREETRYSARWHTEYAFSDALTLRTRFEVSHHTTAGSATSGIYVSQGVRLEPLSSLRLDGRIAFFDTEGFSSRIYAYEHDLLYSFSVPVFFNQGRRTYLLVQYEPAASLTLELKYGVTRYVNQTTIGSGLNQVQGSRRRGVGLQIRWEL